MRRYAAALLLAVIAASLPAALTPASPGAAATARAYIEARIEMSYETVLIRLSLDQPASTIEYNLSGVENPVLAAFIKTDNGYVKGAVENGVLVFRMPSPVDRVNITILFGDIYRIRGENVTLTLPLPLSPIGYNTTVEGALQVRASKVTYKKPAYGKVQGTSIVFKNQTVPAGTTIVAKGDTNTYFIILATISQLHRRIIIHKDWAEYRDNITVKLLTDYPIEHLALRLPADYEVLGVEAQLGPYPRRYIQVKRRGDLQLALITLLASPQERGQKTSIVLRLRTNNTASIDAYLGYGLYVNNYTVEICVKGSASITPNPVKTYRDGDYTCYILPEKGPLILDNYYPPVKVEAQVREESNIPYPLIALAAAVVALIGGYAYYSGSRRRRGGEAILEKLDEDKVSRIEELLARREELYRALIDRLREMRSKKAGTTKIIRAIRDATRHDQRYINEIKRIAAGLGESGAKLVAEMDRVTGEIRSLLSRLERAEKAFKAGRITKQEYNKQIEEIEAEIIRRAEELASLIRLLGP